MPELTPGTTSSGCPSLCGSPLGRLQKVSSFRGRSFFHFPKARMTFSCMHTHVGYRYEKGCSEEGVKNSACLFSHPKWQFLFLTSSCTIVSSDADCPQNQFRCGPSLFLSCHSKDLEKLSAEPSFRNLPLYCCRAGWSQSVFLKGGKWMAELERGLPMTLGYFN